MAKNSSAIFLLAAAGFLLSRNNKSQSPRPLGEGRSDSIWPIAETLIKRVGQSVMRDRDGKGTPHYGLDIFAPSGTSVRAATGGTVVRVTDGRSSSDEGKRRAGLWIDIRDGTGKVHRYLHLGDANVKAGQAVTQGQELGTIAKERTSGLGDSGPHVHYEIRETDWLALIGNYGKAIDPLTNLPTRKA